MLLFQLQTTLIVSNLALGVSFPAKWQKKPSREGYKCGWEGWMSQHGQFFIVE